MRADGQTETQIDGWTDVTRLIVAFRNFSNAPNRKRSKYNVVIPVRCLSGVKEEASYICTLEHQNAVSLSHNRPASQTGTQF
jgi:hypothetical protein